MGTALHFKRSFIMSDNTVEIGAHDVHLVDIRHTRNMVFVRLTPHGLGLGLNAALGAETP